MKLLVFSSIAVVGLLLVGWQHEQLGHLRGENANLSQAAAEADRLKADLAKSAGLELQNTDEIDRLREENHDLLKLRNEVNQLRDTRAEFEKINAENQRLQSLAKNTVKTEAKNAAMKPIKIRIDSLYDRGRGTPENTVQTLLWAERSANADELSRCLRPESWSEILRFVGEQNRQNFVDDLQHNLERIVSVEILARRELNTDTIQLGLQMYDKNGVSNREKMVFTFHLRAGEWIVDIADKNGLYF